jgi:hypothetical protein
MARDPGAPAHHHAVQFYGTDESLISTVGAFVSEGLIGGQPAVIIATPAHITALIDELSRRHIDVKQAKHIGDLVCLDAEETLATFMAGARPDPGAFRTNVGRAIEQALGGRVRTAVRAYGEMVDVLWKRGDAEAAIALEILWNELAASHAFELLCGYCMGNFFKQTDHFERVCQQHTHVFADAKVVPFEPRAARHADGSRSTRRGRS